MNAIITTIILLVSYQIQAQSLNICIKDPLDVKTTDKLDQNLIAKEIFFKNVYETLFYYSRATNKIKSNIAKRIQTISKGHYRIPLDKKVPFHTNKTFFVKKNVGYKDIIFSLKDNPLLNSFKITKKGLEFHSTLSLRDLYIELSRPATIIKSKAYWNYLKKIKKTNLFYSKPIGTGPFKIEKLKAAPYLLTSFKRYHLSNKLKKLNYIVTEDYIKNSCDIFWNNDYTQKKVYKNKYSYNFKDSDFDSLIFAVNVKNNKWIKSIIDPFDIASILAKNLENKLTSLPIPLSLSKNYLLNKKVLRREKKRRKIKISFSDNFLKLLPLRRISTKLNKYFHRLNIDYIIDYQNPDLIVDVKYNLNSLKDINTKILCPYKSIGCNKVETIKRIEEILLKEQKIIPLGFIKRVIYYKKDIKNIKFDFEDTIDYSEMKI